MSNLLTNMRDLQFVFFEQLDIEKLFKSEKHSAFSKEDVIMMLKEAEKLAVNVLLPLYPVGDREGCTFQDGKVSVPKSFHDAYRRYVEGGWLCPSRAPEVGGQGMPAVVSTACIGLMQAANYPLVMYPNLTNGAAALIEIYGTEEQKRKYMYRMYTGEFGGTMCLTEPGAGSDVGALKTTARRLPDGRYSITGTKCFITGGDHDLTKNIIHPVLARIEGDPPGTRGISIFIVPKYRVNDDGTQGEFNDIHTGNIEHKMGIHGNATCTLNFGDNGECVGELLGREREGLRVMFHLMNEARVDVGYQALGTASASYEHAVQYAKERIQSVPVWEMKNPDAKAVPIIQHPDVRRDLLWMKCRVEAMRAILAYTTFCFDLAESTGDRNEHDKWMGIAELLIPVCKAWVSDTAMLVCSKAIDVYGGYGYCAEYPAEQYLRDCKITTIYEGTNGIQSLDLVGRKLGSSRGANVMNFAGEIMATIGRAKASEAMKRYASFLEEAGNAVIDLVMTFGGWGRSSSFLLPILNASPFLEIFGDVVAGVLLMQAAVVAEEKLAAIYAERGADTIGKQRTLVHEDPDVAFYAGKIASARFFASEGLSTVKARCEAIKFIDRSPLEMADESFAE